MGSDDGLSSDEGGADADAELNRKVALVIQPLMKKLKKQGKKLDNLEATVARHQAEQEEALPRLDSLLEAQTQKVESSLERVRLDIGDRVKNEDHARVGA